MKRSMCISTDSSGDRGRACRAVVSALIAGCTALLTATSTRAQALVKVTPLGSHAGELCVDDRAVLFEDPTGVRILYDPGRTVDERDPRLGEVHLMLLSHAHVDHIGDRRPGSEAVGSCGAPAQGPANAASNFASIAAMKNAAAFFPSSEMDVFVGAKIQRILGTPTALCVPRNRDDETIVPRSSPCTARIHPGGSLVVRRAGATEGVRIAAVQAMHPSGIPAALLDAPGSAPGTGAYGGIAGGFVLMFSNGLRAYLTGDTGLFSDMQVIAAFYRPSLVVINIGDVGTLGPAEAAFAIQQWIRPSTVMPTHTYEQSTVGGGIRRGSRFERFVGLVHDLVDIVVPISNVTRTFDGEGRCVGCR